jgi:hypothetical protein
MGYEDATTTAANPGAVALPEWRGRFTEFPRMPQDKPQCQPGQKPLAMPQARPTPKYRRKAGQRGVSRRVQGIFSRAGQSPVHVYASGLFAGQRKIGIRT